jgi:curved DNA-binding protein CbpA
MFQAIPVDKDLYALLGVKSGASMMEIRAAYRRVALKAHPDKGGSAGDFHAISQAFDILSCYSRRRCYDRARDLQTPFVNAAQTHIEKVAKVTRSKRHFNTTVSKAGLAEGEPRNKRMPPPCAICTVLCSQCMQSTARHQSRRCRHESRNHC